MKVKKAKQIGKKTFEGLVGLIKALRPVRFLVRLTSDVGRFKA